MRNEFKIYLIFVPAVCLLLFSVCLWGLKNSQPEVTLRIQGFDPRDLLSGHYISYDIDWENSDCSQFENNVCPVDRFRLFSRHYGYRFYIPEQHAAELDRRFRAAFSNNDVFEIVYAYSSRFRPMAKKLLINGKDWQEVIIKNE